MRRRAAQSRCARGALSRALDRRSHALAGRRCRAISSRARLHRARSRDRARHRRRARARGSPSSTKSASAISRSTARRPRCPAAKRSASGSRRSSARTCAASATSSTSRPSACIRATTACCSTRSRSSQAKGNTLVVVEHDEDTIRRAAHVIDLGPGAGSRGGARRRARHGRRSDGDPDSVTGRFLARRCASAAAAARDRRAHAGARHRRRATCTTCDNVSARVPLARLTVVTGVSGTGKSTLARDVLLREPARASWRSRARRKRRGASSAASDLAAGSDRARARSRPDADRQDAALLPGDLRRLLGRDPPAVRRHERGAHARLFREPVLVQHRGRALPGMRRPGREDASR